MSNLKVDLKFDYSISTTINGKEIHQVISSTDIMQDKLTQISRQVYNTADEQIRL